MINGKNGKTYLEQQGYDVSDLKKAKADFLKDQKDLLDTQKQNFNLNAALMNDVSEDYKNYALGFSSKKLEVLLKPVTPEELFDEIVEGKVNGILIKKKKSITKM